MQRAILRNLKDLALEQVGKPACPKDGLLLEVKACAVCATDVKIYNYGHHLLQLPRVLGHEIAGVIQEVGATWKDRFQVGLRVAVCAVINCGECGYCRRGCASMCLNLKAFGYDYDGGYQEFMAVPVEAIRCGGVNPLPDTLSFEEASLAELLACCINGQRLSGFGLGQTVLILGAGPVGILHAQLAKTQGTSSIYLADVNPKRLEQAERICKEGLTGVLEVGDNEAFAKRVSTVTERAGFDQVMVCCSAPSAQQVSLDCVGKCGCVNFFGGLPHGHSQVTLDTNHIHYKQCRVVGTHGSTADDNKLALDLIARGDIRVKPLITNIVDLTKLESALQIDAPKDGLKTIVMFD